MYSFKKQRTMKNIDFRIHISKNLRLKTGMSYSNGEKTIPLFYSPTKKNTVFKIQNLSIVSKLDRHRHGLGRFMQLHIKNNRR